MPLLTTFLCYLALGYSSSNSVHGLIGPLFMVFILSYCVVNVFVEVFGMAISTILVCYCADEEMFPPEERFADGALRGAIKKTAQGVTDGQVMPDANVVAVKAKVLLRLSITENSFCCQSPQSLLLDVSDCVL